MIITNYLFAHTAVMARVMNSSHLILNKIARRVSDKIKNGGKLVIFGNGGSAADAQHIATELTGGYLEHKRKPIAALSLTTDTSALTAIGNDYGFDQVFKRQVEALVTSKDAVLALSTSGNSKNVVLGAISARKKGALVVGITGLGGGKLRKHCHLWYGVPSSTTSLIQECTMAIGHALCGKLEASMMEGD